MSDRFELFMNLEMSYLTREAKLLEYKLEFCWMF